MKKIIYFFPILFLILNCQTKIENEKTDVEISIQDSLIYNDSIKTAHILVALCDNKYQGIVPVPTKIGNGQDLMLIYIGELVMVFELILIKVKIGNY